MGLNLIPDILWGGHDGTVLNVLLVPIRSTLPTFSVLFWLPHTPPPPHIHSLFTTIPALRPTCPRCVTITYLPHHHTMPMCFNIPYWMGPPPATTAVTVLLDLHPYHPTTTFTYSTHLDHSVYLHLPPWPATLPPTPSSTTCVRTFCLLLLPTLRTTEVLAGGRRTRWFAGRAHVIFNDSPACCASWRVRTFWTWIITSVMRHTRKRANHAPHCISPQPATTLTLLLKDGLFGIQATPLP